MEIIFDNSKFLFSHGVKFIYKLKQVLKSKIWHYTLFWNSRVKSMEVLVLWNQTPIHLTWNTRRKLSVAFVLRNGFQFYFSLERWNINFWKALVLRNPFPNHFILKLWNKVNRKVLVTWNLVPKHIILILYNEILNKVLLLRNWFPINSIVVLQ